MHGYLYLYILAGVAVVKCCQTSKTHNMKLVDLTREDGEALSVAYLVKGASLIMKYRKKPYQVQFVQFKGIYIYRSICIHNI